MTANDLFAAAPKIINRYHRIRLGIGHCIVRRQSFRPRPSRACGLMTWRPLTPRTHLGHHRSHSFAGQLAGLLHPSG
jgi:hypothetical protein